MDSLACHLSLDLNFISHPVSELYDRFWFFGPEVIIGSFPALGEIIPVGL